MRAPSSGLCFASARGERWLHKRDFFSIIEEMSRSFLSEFELTVVLVVISLGDEAYGVPISRELEGQSGREISVGSVYATLERLEKKGLVSSRVGDPTPERGGRGKRYFQVTREGLRQIHETRRRLTRLWRRLPELKGERA
jgi:DNA-binding PadR family transcriptional regulator